MLELVTRVSFPSPVAAASREPTPVTPVVVLPVPVTPVVVLPVPVTPVLAAVAAAASIEPTPRLVNVPVVAVVAVVVSSGTNPTKSPLESTVYCLPLARVFISFPEESKVTTGAVSTGAGINDGVVIGSAGGSLL